MKVTVVYSFGPGIAAVYGEVMPGAEASGILPTLLAVHTDDGQTDIPIDHIARIDHFDSRPTVLTGTVKSGTLLRTWVPGDPCPCGLEKVYDKNGEPWYRDGRDLWTDVDGKYAETWPQLLQHGPVTDRYIGLRAGV